MDMFMSYIKLLRYILLDKIHKIQIEAPTNIRTIDQGIQQFCSSFLFLRQQPTPLFQKSMWLSSPSQTPIWISPVATMKTKNILLDKF